MTRVDTSRTMSEAVTSLVATSAADEELLADAEVEEDRSAWDQVIDDRLIEWGRDPSQLEDDDIEVPSREIIRLACCIAQAMRDAGMPAPLRVVPDGDGGITFEHKADGVFQAMEIDEDGSVELITFVDSRLVSRQQLYLG